MWVQEEKVSSSSHKIFQEKERNLASWKCMGGNSEVTSQAEGN